MKNLFVPDSYFEGSVEDFWRKIPSLDEEFEKKRQEASANNQRFRFVAKMEVAEDGKVNASVGLQLVGISHSFYELEGSNNIVTLTTERYKEYPMLIQGYGAGASVTAAGVFANVMSIANI